MAAAMHEHDYTPIRRLLFGFSGTTCFVGSPPDNCSGQILRYMNFPPLAAGEWRTNQQQQSRRYQSRGSPPASPGTAGRLSISGIPSRQSPGSPRSRGRLFVAPPAATSKSARLTARSLSPPPSSGGHAGDGFEHSEEQGWGQGQGQQHRMGRLGKGRGQQGDGRRRRSRSGSMFAAAFSPLFSAPSSPTVSAEQVRVTAVKEKPPLPPRPAAISPTTTAATTTAGTQANDCSAGASKYSFAAKEKPPLPPRLAATKASNTQAGECSVAEQNTSITTIDVENVPLIENFPPPSPAEKATLPEFPSRAHTGPGTNAGTDARSRAETGAGTGAGTEAGTDAGTAAGTGDGTGAGIGAGIGAGTGAGAGAGTSAGTSVGACATIRNGLKSDTKQRGSDVAPSSFSGRAVASWALEAPINSSGDDEGPVCDRSTAESLSGGRSASSDQDMPSGGRSALSDRPASGTDSRGYGGGSGDAVREEEPQEASPSRKEPGEAKRTIFIRNGEDHGRLAPADDGLDGMRESEGRAASKEGGRSGDDGQEGPERGGGGGGERPTQVLRVPEIATRDTEEKLGIQVCEV